MIAVCLAGAVTGWFAHTIIHNRVHRRAMRIRDTHPFRPGGGW